MLFSLVVTWTSCWTHSPLQWRHNGHDGVSNHQPYDCLLNCLFRHRSKKTSKLRVTGLCDGNSPVTGEFPAQRASKAEHVSIWWRHNANYVRFETPWPMWGDSTSHDGFPPQRVINAELRCLTHWSREEIDEISQMIFLNAFSWMKYMNFDKISLEFVPKGPIKSITVLVHIMVWHRPGDKPLSEPMMVRLLTRIRHSASMS